MFGSYWDHIEQYYLLQAHYPNLKFITFETMKHNLELTLNELCIFLDTRITEQQMQRLIRHLQFQNMKANPAINPLHLKVAVQKNRPGSNYNFVRRGDIDSHKDEMSKEYIIKFNEITRMRLQSLGLYQSF